MHGPHCKRVHDSREFCMRVGPPSLNLAFRVSAFPVTSVLLARCLSPPYLLSPPHSPPALLSFSCFSVPCPLPIPNLPPHRVQPQLLPYLSSTSSLQTHTPRLYPALSHKLLHKLHISCVRLFDESLLQVVKRLRARGGGKWTGRRWTAKWRILTKRM